MLPDLFTTNMRLVICGTAAGETSAQRKQYYAGPGNKFWATLYEVGLTPKRFNPSEYQQLLQYGIGFTDLVKNKAGMDRTLKRTDFGKSILTNDIKQYQPGYVCFNGKKAAQEFFDRPVNYGLQEFQIGQTKLFVAPSTSGAANKWWDIEIWKELARLVAQFTVQEKKN